MVLGHNAGTVNLLSEGRLNVLESVDFGSFLRELTITGTGELVIDDALAFAFGEVHIDASANTGGIRLKVDSVADGSSLSNEIGFSAVLDEVTIKGSQGRDVIEISGTAAGVLLDIDTGAGRDTVFLTDDTLSAGAGSVITGDNLTVVVTATADLRKADVVGVDRFVLNAGPAAAGNLVLTQTQVEAMDAGVFTAAHNTIAVLSVEITEAGTVLSDLIDLSALSSDVKLAFNVVKGASLEMTAEELHKYVAFEGIDATMAGHLVITGAGLGFDPEDQSDYDTGGTIANYGLTPDQNISIIRDPNGFERPAPDTNTDILTIDTTGGITIGANALSDDDAFSTNATTLIIEGAGDITFNAPLEMLLDNYTIDFSGLTGNLNGLTILDFQNITDGNDPSDWGQIIGNPDVNTRINVVIEDGKEVGDDSLGNANGGLKSSGVETYVVLGTVGETYTFNVCDTTQGLEVLGFRGLGDVTFNQINWGTNLLLEGDGFENFGDIPKAFANPNQSNIGSIEANYFFDGATVDVAINNQGQALGTTSTGAARPLVVESIVVNGAETVNLAIEDGSAWIKSVDGSVLEDLTVTSDFHVTLSLIAANSDLESIDGSGVVGVMALEISDVDGAGDPTALTVDLSSTELSGIDQIDLGPLADLTLNIDQIEDIGTANIAFTGTAAQAQNDPATLNIGQFAEQEFDITTVGLEAGVELGTVTFVANAGEITMHPDTNLSGATAIVIPEGTTVNMTAAQYEQIVDGGNGSSFSGLGVLNITDLLGEPELDTNGDPIPGAFASDINLSGVPVEMMGSISLAAGVDSMRLTGNIGIAQFEEREIADPDNTDFVSVQTSHNFHELTGETQGFSFVLAEDQNLIFTTEAQAHNRVVEGDGSKVTLAFAVLLDSQVNFNTLGGTLAVDGLNLAYYSDLTDLEVLQALVAGTNVEQILGNLDENTVVQISEFIAGANFANPTFRDVEVLEGVTVAGGLVFENLNDELPDSLKLTELSLSLLGDATITGTVDISGAPLLDQGFETLTINSLGDDPNTINNVVATGNDLIDVVINAEQDLSVQTITLSFVPKTPGQTSDATLTVNGDADVTIKTLDSTDPDINVVNIDNNLTGGATLTFTGGSAAFEGDDTDSLILTGAGNTVFDTEGASTGGIDSDSLSLIDASEHTGDLDLGRIISVDEANFSLLTSAGNASATLQATMNDQGFNAAVLAYNAALAADPVVPGNVTAALTALTTAAGLLGFVDANEDPLAFTQANAADLIAEFRPEWNFELGANTELTIDGDDIVGADFVAGALVISGGKLIIEGEVDLRDLAVLDISDVEIELAAGARILMTDEQFDALDNVTFSGPGQTLEVDDALLAELSIVNDITDIRGVTEIQLEEGLVEDITMTAEQARIATVVDADGNPVLVDFDVDPTVIDAAGDPVEAGDFRTLTGSVVTVEVTGNDDLTDLAGLNRIEIVSDDLVDLKVALDLDGANNQVAALQTAAGGAFDGTFFDVLSNFTVEASFEVLSQFDPETTLFVANPIVEDVNFDIVRDVNGDVTSVSVSGGSSLGFAQSDAGFQELLEAGQVTEVVFENVGSLNSILVSGNFVGSYDAGGIFYESTFEFGANAGSVAEGVGTDGNIFTIAEFTAGAAASDILDFTAMPVDNTNTAPATGHEFIAVGTEASIGDDATIIVFTAGVAADAATIVTQFADGAGDFRSADATARNADFAIDSQLIFLIDDGAGNTGVWYWDDTVGAVGDGIVDADELSQIAQLTGVVTAELTVDNFVLA